MNSVLYAGRARRGYYERRYNTKCKRGSKKPIIVLNDTKEQNHEPMHELEDLSAMDPREVDRYKLAFHGTNDGLCTWRALLPQNCPRQTGTVYTIYEVLTNLSH